jgi:glycosyltransferase involved in cell wall biosynthesis
MHKILFVTISLTCGGAEKRAALISRYLDRSQFKPEFALFHESEINFAPDPDTPINFLKGNTITSITYLCKHIQETRPSAILSFGHRSNYRAVLARILSRERVPLFLSHDVNLTAALRYEEKKRLKGWLVRGLYPLAERTLCVSQGVKSDLVSNYKVPEEKCLVIYNPLEIDKIAVLAQEPVEHPWFQGDVPVLLACGRLTAAKNYPLLLRAVKLALPEQPVRLVILGTGEDRPQLEAYAGELGISPQVAFLGFQKNPYKYMARAAALVLSSSVEGFANVLLEAMACGTPVVSTRCPSGPEEIITPEEDGLLVPIEDAPALAADISRLLADAPLRQRLAAGGKRRAADFRVEKIVRQYENVFLAF